MTNYHRADRDLDLNTNSFLNDIKTKDDAIKYLKDLYNNLKYLNIIYPTGPSPKKLPLPSSKLRQSSSKLRQVSEPTIIDGTNRKWFLYKGKSKAKGKGNGKGKSKGKGKGKGKRSKQSKKKN